MSLTADREYGCINPDEFVEGIAGAADTLYKGGIASFGTNGYVKVAAAVANEVPMGLMKKQVVAAGANAEHVEIDTGIIAVAKVSQEKTTLTLTGNSGGSSNAAYNNKYFWMFDGTTPYYVWFNVNSTGTDPDPDVYDNETGIEVAIATTDNASQIATKLATAIDGYGGANVTWDASPSSAVVTAIRTAHGACTNAVNGNTAGDGLVVIATTVYGTAIQSDVHTLFYAITDDGVVYSAAKGSANIALGLCVGLVGHDNELWIDTNIKSL
jgi:hypothetical protein